MALRLSIGQGLGFKGSFLGIRLKNGFRVCGLGGFGAGRGLGTGLRARILPHVLPHILHTAIGGDDVGQVVVVFFQLHEVGDVKECIALEADIDESRLHSGKDARDAAFVDGSSEGVFVLAFHVDFREKIIFHQAHFGFVRRGRYK